MHQTLFSYSCRMAEEAADPEQVIDHIRNSVAVTKYRRLVPDREIVEAVRDAYDHVLIGAKRSTVPFTVYDVDAAGELFQKWNTILMDLDTLSPKSPPNEVRLALQGLFLDTDLVCMGRDVRKPQVKSLKHWLKLSDDQLSSYQFIVPNAMSALEGPRKSDGRMSPRTQANTGDRKYIVCDFDVPPKMWHPSLINHLIDFCGTMPALVLTSGGKSLHAWWRCYGMSDDDIATFEYEAVRVGADPAIMGDNRKNQFVRLPNGTRDDGNSQDVYYWNPMNG